MTPTLQPFSSGMQKTRKPPGPLAGRRSAQPQEGLKKGKVPIFPSPRIVRIPKHCFIGPQLTHLSLPNLSRDSGSLGHLFSSSVCPPPSLLSLPFSKCGHSLLGPLTPSSSVALLPHSPANHRSKAFCPPALPRSSSPCPPHLVYYSLSQTLG